MKNFRPVFLLPLLVFLVSAGTDPELPKVHSFTYQLKGTSTMMDVGECSLSDWLAYVYNKAYNENTFELNVPLCDSLMPDTNLLPEKYRMVIRLFYRLDQDHAPASTKWHTYFGENDYMHSVDIPLTKEELDNDTLKTHIKKNMQNPIVGVSYENAEKYCAWRAKEMSKEKNVIASGYKVKGRLLTLDEWNVYSKKVGPRMNGNHSEIVDTVNKEGCYLLNIKTDKPCPSLLEGRKIYGEGTLCVFSFNPDSLGFYNLYGNVAEMLQEKGKAYGGSYSDYGNECTASRVIPYAAPAEWLGFRCVFDFSK